MKIYLRKTYLLKFKQHEDYIQFSIELKNKLLSKIIFNLICYKKNFYYICKIPTSLERVIPHIQEYCELQHINAVEEAFIKEYGLIKL